MKKALMIVTLILSGIGFIAVLFGFIETLSQGVIAAIFSAVVGLAIICPLVAVAILLNSVDRLETQVNYLENELIRKDIKNNPIEESAVPIANKGRNAIVDWTCPKCKTVNKKGTSNCENCGAAH